MPLTQERPSGRAPRSLSKGLVILGLFLCATFGGPLLADWLREVPAGTVMECKVHNAHGPVARVTLQEGRGVSLRTKDLAYPEHCVPLGTSLEKRRFELAYRFNGRPQVAGDPTHLVALLTSGLGTLLVLAGAILAVRRRTRTPLS